MQPSSRQAHVALRLRESKKDPWWIRVVRRQQSNEHGALGIKAQAGQYINWTEHKSELTKEELRATTALNMDIVARSHGREQLRPTFHGLSETRSGSFRSKLLGK